ncbi:MAG: alpha/beta hydrolase [Zavarzinia sp.]|nr:alpha/beta hydrolase [Zavarzinia sp.]
MNWLVVGLAVGLAGCGGRPEGVLTPIASGVPVVPGAHVVDMVVATTRARDARPGEMYNGERALGLTFADIAVSIPPDSGRKVGEVQWPSQLPPNPAKEFATLKAVDIDPAAAAKQVQLEAAKYKPRRVLVFVHGYNNRFDDAVYRFAQIMHDSHAPAAPVLFTWPSRASLLAYGYDRESANYSRDALENVLTFLARDPKIDEVSILAHSMGNWVTMEALRQMAIRNGHIPKKIANVMLAAPAVAADVFRTQMLAIGEPRPHFTLFVSTDDKALAMSRRIWGSSDRLGEIDPDKEPYKSRLAQADLEVVNMSKIQTGDRLGHGKFAESPQMVQLIGTRLVEGQPVNDGKVGLGDRIGQIATGTGAAVGAAAGLIITAPVAIVDSDTRANYGARIGDVVPGSSSAGGPPSSAPPPPIQVAAPK